MSSQRRRQNMPGIINSTQMNVGKSYVEEKFHGARGHGFAAERANDLHDNMTGKNANIVGDGNEKNGADRIVNGINIQSKYCASGSKCVRECFDSNGNFRYYNDPKNFRDPMQIEVPSDKYDDAVRAMQERINKGQISGVKDAKEIIRKGNVTYEQAKNIAKAGTVESLTYDGVNGIKIGAYSGGISAAITFAVASWNGKNFEEALENSVLAGLQTGGIAWASSILVGQMTKAGVNSLLVSSSESLLSLLGPKASAYLVNAFRSGTEIYGAAAMKSAAKLLRCNVVTGVATLAVMSASDVVEVLRGRISGTQFVKNVINTGAGIGGGVAGWTGGATAGATLGSVIPGVGNVIGGLAGGLLGAFLGSSVASKTSQAVTNEFIEDDAKKMEKILSTEFKYVAADYLLNESECKQIAEKEIDHSKLKDMYASNNRQKFARILLIHCAERIVEGRKKIHLPTTQDYIRGLRNVLEKAS